MIKLFVGLGNPGPEYEATRHNAGFWWIDALARDLKLSLSPERSYHGLVARTQAGGKPLWLLEPQTFMNLSGKSVAALARFFKIEPKEILVSQVGGGKQALALHGTTRAVIANMVTGVTAGFTKTLEITGTGYRAQLAGKKLTLQLGYSHPIEFDPPAGITIQVETPTKLHVLGFDKGLVGQVAANIRGFRPPEPYKGKGIKYAGEYIRRKAGKAAGGKSA